MLDAILEEISDQMDLAMLPPLQIPMTIEQESPNQKVIIRETPGVSLSWLFNLIGMTVSFVIGRRWRPN